MKKNLIIPVFIILSLNLAVQVKAQGVKWDESYAFDKSNNFQMEIYAKGNELMRTIKFATNYLSNGENFITRALSENKGTGMETIIDKKYKVAIQMFGTGGGAVPTYNAGAYKFPETAELKKLEIVATDETKEILGYTCKKYSYTYKKIFGEVWITDQIDMPNDIGVFRACKMAALHNTLSVPGFVMEMTTEDAKGGKTLMKTTSLNKDEKYIVDLKGAEISSAINKVNYFVF